MAENDRKRKYVQLGEYEVYVVSRTTGSEGNVTTETKKVVKPVFSKVTEKVITALGLTPDPLPVTKKGDTADLVLAKGVKGSGSIKVDIGGKTPSGGTQYHSIPVPSNFSILDCYSMIKRIIPSTNQSKIKGFVSKHGVTYPYASDMTLPTGGTKGDEIELTSSS